MLLGKTNEIRITNWLSFHIISYVLFDIDGVRGTTTCTKQSDCYDTNADPCAICINDSQNTILGHCVDIYPNVYESSPSCIKYDNTNCPLKCSGKGSCTTFFSNAYTPYCVCQADAYGESCQYNNPKKAAKLSSVKMKFNGVVSACETTQLEFSITSFREGILDREIDVYMKIEDYSFRRYPNLLLQENYIYGILQYYTIMKIRTIFPYKNKGLVYKLGDALIGYNTTVSLFIYIDGTREFQNLWNVFVKYEDLKCFPVISTTNCAANMEHPAVFLRGNAPQISIDVAYIADGTHDSRSTKDPKCSVDERMSWKIWKITGGTSFDMPTNENYTRSRNIHFQPYELEIGEHEVEITVINYGSNKPVSDTKYCYIKVTCIPLVAKVEGGSDRMVSPNIGLLFRADSSYDPNMPPYDQGHLNIDWSCVNVNHPERESMCETRHLSLSQSYYTPSKSLSPGSIYNFTVKVWTNIYDRISGCDKSVSPSFSHFRVEVSNDTQLGNVDIVCLDNCGAKVVPNYELYLKAVQPFISNLTSWAAYDWSFYKNEGTVKEEFADSIKRLGVRSELLIVNENALEYGCKYTIVARVINSHWYAKYSFETYSIDFDVTCAFVPESGTKGLTQFEITCTVHKNLNNEALSYEFYDKNNEEANEGFIYSGRMLGTSNDGKLKKVRLTRGNLMVYVLNQYGLYLNMSYKVELKQWEVNDKIMNELYHNISNEVRFGSVPNTLGALSFIPDIIPEGKTKSEILNTLLSFVTDLTLNDMGDMKLCASTLTNVLLTLNKPIQLRLEPHYIAETIKTINDLADIFSQKIVSGEVKNMSPKEVKLVTVSILNCLETSLSSRDNQTENIQEGTFDIFTERHLQYASLHMESALELITKTLSYVQVSGQNVTKISSKDGKFITWIMENDDFYTIPEQLSDQKEIPVQFSNELYNEILNSLNKNENIALQVLSINDNIFWWSLSDIRTKLISVSLNKKYKKARILPIKYVDKPMTILMDINKDQATTKINDSTLLPDNKMDAVHLDLAVKIHRFDIAPRSLMTIKFLYPPTNGTLRVFVMDNFRPDYAIMMEKGINVNEKSSTYHVPYYDVYNEPYLLFMGLLPGPEVAVNQSVMYDFEINTTVCKIWIGRQWSSAGCIITKTESDNPVHCGCTHFSIFAAAFPVPPNSIDPFSDAKLFLTVIDNPLVVGFVIIVLLIYLLLCLCIWRSDKKIKSRRNIIVLDDNFSHDKVPYLIAVYTSSRLNAGTSAHVGITVIGSLANSRTHVFKGNNRSVLQRNTDDWFLIYCPLPLGDVEGLHIWHDNTGSSPEWLCNKIFVYDLLGDTETLFIVEEWLALNEHEYPEAYVLSAAIDDIINVKSLFVNNVILGLRESHVLLSCVVCHPRSDLPRLERLSIFMCSFMVAMLCSIMFYMPQGDRMYIDDYGYSIGTRQLYVGLETLIISVFSAFVVFYLFKKSYKTTYIRHQTTLRVREHPSKGTSVIYSFDKKLNDPIGGNLYKNFVRIVTKTVKSNPLDPVQLPNSEPITEVQRFWLILSWTICITIICVSSYLVMIYGLKLGLVTSKEWLSSLLIAMGGEILIFAPVRIIFMSSLLAIALLKMFDLSLHEVTAKDLRLVRIPNDIKYNNKVISQRSQPMYKPLRKGQRDKMLQNIERKRKLYTVVDFIITILTLVVFHNLIFQLWTMNYHTNSHVIKMVTQAKHDYIYTVDFFRMHDISSFNEYLQYTFVSSLYNLRWYNQQLLQPDESTSPKDYWAADFTHRSLGLPIIRQLRVVPVKCDNIVVNGVNCVPRWSARFEDKDDYTEMWKPATWSDIVKPTSPWHYTEEEGNFILDEYNLYSPSGTRYAAGGYTAVLGPRRSDTELMLAELKEDSWQDVQTRVVFVEFSMYNVNEDVFVKVTLMVEYLISGATLPKAQSLSFKTGKYLSVWNILFVILIIYYILRCVQLLNRHGIVQFIYQFNNVCRLAIVCLGVISLILFPIHYYVSKKYSESFHRKGLDTHFDFNSLVLYYILLRHVLSILLCIAILHAIALLKSSRALLRHYYTVVTSLKWIIWLTTAAVLNLFAIFCISTLFVIPGSYNVMKMTVIERSLEDLQPEQLQHFHVKLFAIIKIVSIQIWLWTFVIMFIFYSKLAKVYKYRKLD